MSNKNKRGLFVVFVVFCVLILAQVACSDSSGGGKAVADSSQQGWTCYAPTPTPSVKPKPTTDPYGGVTSAVREAERQLSCPNWPQPCK